MDGILEKYGGTGVGLYVTKELIKIQGGTIKVSSVIGKGSEFIFTLPICTEQELKSNLNENLYNKDNEETAEILAKYSKQLEIKPNVVNASMQNVRKIIKKISSEVKINIRF